MFNPNNFYQKISIHKEFHEERRRRQNRKSMMIKAGKATAIVLTVASVALAIKYNGKIKSLIG